MARLSRLQIERFFRYYHYLTRHFAALGERNAKVSSAELAAYLEVDPTLVRKDLAVLKIRGVPRVGYQAKKVVRAIERTLGFTREHRGVIVGAGRLGGAIAAYEGFKRYGFHFVALFDIDPRKVGTVLEGRPVLHMDKLPEYVARHDISFGVITVPIPAAQEAADQLVRAGLKAIWNFAHVALKVPSDVFVRNEHISIGLAELAYYLRREKRRARARSRKPLHKEG